MVNGNNRVDQKFYAPVGQPGQFGAWRIVIYDPPKEGERNGVRTERVVVASSLVPVVARYGSRLMEAEFLCEGECIIETVVAQESKELA